MRPLINNTWVVLIVVLVAGCISAVSEEDVYRTDTIDPKLGSAKNIVVEQTPDGMKISGSELSVLALITRDSFKIKTEPEEMELEYTVGGMEFDSRTGSVITKANIILGKDSTVPAQLPSKGARFFDSKLYRFIPGTSGSQNVSVKINQEVGYTDIAGLHFKQEAVFNIWEDGTVEMNKEDIVASDTNGNEWISKKVKFGDKIATIMIKKK